MKQHEIAAHLDDIIRRDRTFEEVAKQAGVAPATLRRFLHKGRNIRVDRLIRVLEVLNMDLKIVARGK